MPKEPLSGSEYRLIGGTTFILGILLMAVVRLEAIDREPQWNFPAKAAIPQPNGYDTYFQAESIFVNFSPAVDPILDTRWRPNSKNPAVDYALPRRKAWLQANQMSFSLLAQARKMTCLQPLESAPVRRRFGFNLISKYCAIASKTYLLDRQWDRSVELGLDGVEACLDTVQGGTADDLSRAMDASRYTYRPILRAIPNLSETQALSQANRMRQLLETLPKGRDVLENSKWESLYRLQKIMEAPGWRDLRGAGISMTTSQQFSFNLIPKDQFRQQLTSIYDGLLSDLDNSRPPRSSYYSGSDPMSIFMGNFLGPVSYMTFTRQAYLTRLRMLLLSFHLQAYRAHHGQYPATLTDLKTLDITKYPDPFWSRSRPFHYLRTPSGYKLWSVAQNGLDDGGTVVSGTRDGLQRYDTDSGDIVVSMPLPPPEAASSAANDA